jgi:hypothetical protein
MLLLAVGPLAGEPLAAAAEFYARVVPQALAAGGDVALHFAGADHTHRGWRLAAVQELARALVPFRVNGVQGDDAAALAAAVDYLAAAPGVTGQVLQLDSQGAGAVIG